jgi:hypothetical protein
MTNHVKRSLNLTPERSGSSVWNEPAPPTGSQWSLAAFAVGAAMIGAAWRRPRHPWLLGVGVSSVVIGLVTSIPTNDLLVRARARRSVAASDPLDEGLAETFPASDPPASSAPQSTT